MGLKYALMQMTELNYVVNIDRNISWYCEAIFKLATRIFVMTSGSRPAWPKA